MPTSDDFRLVFVRDLVVRSILAAIPKGNRGTGVHQLSANRSLGPLPLRAVKRRKNMCPYLFISENGARRPLRIGAPKLRPGRHQAREPKTDATSQEVAPAHPRTRMASWVRDV